MGAFAKRGGYVITTPEKKYVSNSEVDQKKLQKIAEILGISPEDRAKLKVISTIYVDASGKK